MASIWKVKKNNTSPRRVVRFFFGATTEVMETTVTELGTDFATEQSAKTAVANAGLQTSQYSTIEYVEQ